MCTLYTNMHQYVRQHICTQVHVHSLPTCNITTTVSPFVIKIPGKAIKPILQLLQLVWPPKIQCDYSRISRPFFPLSIVNDRLSIGSKKKAKNNLVTATVIMILYEHTHQAGETTDDKYIQVKPLYLILFSPFKRYFRQRKAFDWFRGLVFGSEEFFFWSRF